MHFFFNNFKLLERVLCKNGIFAGSDVGWMRSKGGSELKPLDTYLSYKDESEDLYDYKVGDMTECFKGMKTAQIGIRFKIAIRDGSYLLLLKTLLRDGVILSKVC